MKQHQNTKDSIIVKASIDKQISKIKKTVQRSNIVKFLFVILLFAFCLLNFVYSQFVSPIYFKFSNNDKGATISFLQQIKTIPEYQRILEMNDNVFENTVSEAIFYQENKKKVLINNLEQQLLINPKARDVLYSLYKLFLADGNKYRAEEYLKRAKKIDPSLK